MTIYLSPSSNDDIIVLGINNYTPVVDDSTPSQFLFSAQANVALSTTVESNTITVSGINVPAAISVTGGQYAVNSGSGFGAFTPTTTTVSNGDQVKVNRLSSGSNSTAVDVVLTIGGVSDTFTVTTLASVPSDSIPAQFTLGADVTGAALNAVTVRSFTIADIDASTTFNATGDAEVSADGSTNWGSSFTVSAPSTGYMRLTASGSNSTAVTGGVESGGISDSITVTTIEAVQTPNIILGGDNDVLADEVATLTSGLFNHTSDTLAFLDNGSEKYALGYVSDGVVRIPSNIPSGTYTIIVRVAA